MTKGTIRDRVAAKIGMSSAEELAFLEGWVDEAVEQYLVETKALVREGIMTLTSGVSDYTLPTGILSFSSVWVVPAVGDTVELEQVGSSEMLRKRRYTYTGDNPNVYQLLGMDLLRLYPTPSTGSTLHVLYVPEPGSVAVGTDLSAVGVPLADHPTIEEYVSWKAADWDDDTSSKVGQAYMQGWDMGLRRARIRRNRLDNGWGPARPGRRRYIPTRPGVDMGW